MRKTLLATLLALATMGAMAQRTEIYPKPQEVAWGQGKAFDNTATYTLTGADDADADAVALLAKHFTTQGGTVSLTIGERGDNAIAVYENLIPAKTDGYYLNVSPEGVIIAGNDEAGTYYGVQTYLQLTEQPEVQEVTITDWPDVLERGVVEGFYGNPWSHQDRLSQFEFYGRHKLNVYIYGPKDDPYHRGRWREHYPDKEAQMISELAKAAAANKVDFVWAMHPGGDINWDEADRQKSIEKLEKMYALGVRAFAIFFDDIFGGEQSKADKQAEYLNYLNTEFVQKHDDVAQLIMCPTEYNRGWAGSNYLDVLGTNLDKDTHIMWTGNSVVDMIDRADMDWINNRIKRNAYIWLNYPVNDYCIDHMLMGPTYGNDLNIASQLGGFTSNPMEYAEASKVSLFSIADYSWNMAGYDANASWEGAIAYLMPEHREAFHLFCENNVDLGPTGHGLRREGESPRFVKAMAEFNTLIEQGDTLAAADLMHAHFKLMADAAAELIACDENPALIAEITPWCEVMRYMGLKGVELANMYNALAQAAPEAFIESYLCYAQYDEAQRSVRSRDFEGSIKTPNPAVATTFVAPFLKSVLSVLINTYKQAYDYRTEVFPAQEVENGTYYIMHNGRYLTNLNENVAGSAPRFVALLDSVKPLRQQWHIALDAETERYKIVNAEDNRYLNENAKFSANNSTNPYEAIWHTYTMMRLANGKYCIQNGGSAGDKFWTVSGDQAGKSGSAALEPAHFIFDLVPIDGHVSKAPITDTEDTYYIMDGERYLTNTNPGASGGTPIFTTVDTPSEAQEWNITIDAEGKNHYKITSKADGRYVNEYAVFGTNPYYADWNTYLILTMDGMCAVKITQSAADDIGQRFWNVKGDRLEMDESLNSKTSYVIRIVSKNEHLSGIPQTEVDNTTSDAIYTLQGQRLNAAAENLPEGVYIIGNKKRYVK